jgi:hypothetical protein
MLQGRRLCRDYVEATCFKLTTVASHPASAPSPVAPASIQRSPSALTICRSSLIEVEEPRKHHALRLAKTLKHESTRDTTCTGHNST